MKKIFTLSFFIVLALTVQAQIRYLKGVLQGAQETISNTSAAGGVVIIRYNTTTNFLELWGNYRNLSNTVSGSHIHGPAAAGTDAAILWNLTNTGGTNGGLTGTATLTEAQEADLLAGNMYANVHSTGTFANGEIRAQITPVATDKAVLLSGRLQSAQETPPNNSPATGATNVLLDTSTHTLWITATYTGLVATANNAHIHVGAPGVLGAVIIFVKYTAATAGSIDTSRVISVQNETDILNGNTYLNVHSTTYGAGEIRGQLLPATQLIYFANALQNTQEVPANSSTARGTVIVKYNTETNLFELTGDYQNLNATISGSHVHGPAAAGTNAGILFDLTNTGGTMGKLSVSTTLTQAQETDLLAGLWYANVHSTGTYAGGEIRAQLLPTTAGETQYVKGILQPSQSVATPAVVSNGLGDATVLLDKVTRKIFVTANYANLTSGITLSHIHNGAAGVNGAVSFDLKIVPGTVTGTVTGSGTITASLADSLVSGLTYLNIHTTNYGAGEIRGQLGDLVLPVVLEYFNGYKNSEQVVLTWRSSQEVNVKNFEVEQQNTETGEWIKKATVTATGGSAATNYRVADIPLTGKKDYVIYRLKIIDADGKIAYSPTVKINFTQNKAVLAIRPNPVVNGRLALTISGLANDQKAEITVIDISGRTMLKSTVSTLLNNVIDISKLSGGVYKLVVKTNDTTLQETFNKQ